MRVLLVCVQVGLLLAAPGAEAQKKRTPEEICDDGCDAQCKQTYTSAADEMRRDSCLSGCQLPNAAKATPKDISAHCAAPGFLPQKDVAACEAGAKAVHNCKALYPPHDVSTSSSSSSAALTAMVRDDGPPPCMNPAGCFQVSLVASDFMQMATAKDVREGTNHGVTVRYDAEKYAQSVFASIADPVKEQEARNLLVNVSDPRTPPSDPHEVFCVFDLGALGHNTPYLKIAQQHGVQCQFALTETRQATAGGSTGRTFVYSLTTVWSPSEACGSPELYPKGPLCPTAPQPPPAPPQQLKLLADSPAWPPACCFDIGGRPSCMDVPCDLPEPPPSCCDGCKCGDHTVCGRKSKPDGMPGGDWVCPAGAAAEVVEQQQQQDQTAASTCQSTTGCFQVKLAPEQYMQLGDAKNVDPGTNYGVAATYGDYQLEDEYFAQSLFATIQDDDGDLLVNVTRGYHAIGHESAFCVFNIGAEITPYLRIAQQHGLGCKFALVETRAPPAGATAAGPTFVYSLSVDYDAASSAFCGSASLHPQPPLCPDPPQPKPNKMADGADAVTLQI